MTAARPLSAQLLAACICVGLIILLGCAEVQPPSGGEPDKRAPRVDSTFPANASVAVPSGNTVEIFFSERIQSAAGRQVFVSPRPKTDPKLKWHSDRLTISFAEPFAANQTTVITLGSGVTDLRNNRLDSSMTVAFSTGSTLDSGRVGGVVLKDGVGQGGILVGMWNPARLTDSTVLDSLYPDYMTITDPKGHFTLKYLPDQAFRLVAFLDRNKDDRFGSKREPFALPDRQISVGAEQFLDSLVLALTTIDTAGVGVISASFNQNGMARIRLSSEYPLENLVAHLPDATMTPLTDSLASYSAIALLESTKAKSASLTLAFGHIPAGDYQLTLPLRADSSVVFEPIAVRDIADAEPPSLAEHTPGDRALFASDVSISLTFSEPIDTTRTGTETIQLVRSDSLPVPASIRWSDQLHLSVSADTIFDGSTYLVRLSEFEIFDLAGNPLGDSLTTFSFKTLNVDSLGEVAGTVAIRLREQATAPAVLIFRELANKFVDTLAVKGREFRLNLPAGKYLLSGFLDANRDGVRTDGSLAPFRLSETTALYRDTIAVRARFETTGIDFIFK